MSNRGACYDPDQLHVSRAAKSHLATHVGCNRRRRTDKRDSGFIRFGSRLQYFVDVPQHLMPAEVPPFCLQTLVENSVKHGGDEIRVCARNGGSRLILSVWDSGSGFTEGKKVGTPGHGLDNLRGRLAALWGSNAALEFPQNGEGTTVQISLPVKLRE